MKKDLYKHYQKTHKDDLKLKKKIETVPYFKYDPITKTVINLQNKKTISIPYALRIARAYKKYKGNIPKEFATGHKKRLYKKAYKAMQHGQETMSVSILKPQYQYKKQEVQTTVAELPYGKQFKRTIIKVRTRKWGKRFWREQGTIKGFTFYEENRFSPEVQHFFETHMPTQKFKKTVKEGVVKPTSGVNIYLHRLNRMRDKAFNILIIPLNIIYDRNGLYGNSWNHYLYKKRTMIIPQVQQFIRSYGNEMQHWTLYYKLHGMVYSENYGDYDVHITSPFQVTLDVNGIQTLMEELDNSVSRFFQKAGTYEYIEITHITFYFNTSGLPLTEKQRNYNRVGVYGF